MKLLSVRRRTVGGVGGRCKAPIRSPIAIKWWNSPLRAARDGISTTAIDRVITVGSPRVGSYQSVFRRLAMARDSPVLSRSVVGRIG